MLILKSRSYCCHTITIYLVDWGKLMKEALIAKFPGNIGALDRVIETGIVGNCKKTIVFLLEFLVDLHL